MSCIVPYFHIEIDFSNVGYYHQYYPLDLGGGDLKQLRTVSIDGPLFEPVIAFETLIGDGLADCRHAVSQIVPFFPHGRLFQITFLGKLRDVSRQILRGIGPIGGGTGARTGG